MTHPDPICSNCGTASVYTDRCSACLEPLPPAAPPPCKLHGAVDCGACRAELLRLLIACTHPEVPSGQRAWCAVCGARWNAFLRGWEFPVVVAALRKYGRR